MRVYNYRSFDPPAANNYNFLCQYQKSVCNNSEIGLKYNNNYTNSVQFVKVISGAVGKRDCGAESYFFSTALRRPSRMSESFSGL